MSTYDNVPEIDFSTNPETRASIYEFLNGSSIGVLATVGADGKPNAAVVYFSIDENFRLTFVTKKATRKHDNIQENNNVCLVVFDSFSQTTAQIEAVAEELTENEPAEQAFNHMLDTARQTSDEEVPPITKIFAGDYVAYYLRPLRISMNVFVRPDPNGDEMYEAIDFKR